MLPVIKYAFAALLLLASSSASANWTDFIQPSPPCSGNPTIGYTPNSSALDSAYTSCLSFSMAASCRYSYSSSVPQLCGEEFNHIEYWPTWIGSCPSGYVDDGNGNCVEEIQCDTGIETQDLVYLDDLTAPTAYPSDYNIGDCNYRFDSVENCGANGFGISGCWINVVSDGTQSSATEYGNVVPPTFSEDNTETTSSSTTDITQPVINPDSSVTQTETTTETTTIDQGTKVSENPNEFVITNSDGSTITYTQNKIITTNPDGTSTTVNTSSNAYKTPNTTTTTINKGTGSITNNSTTSTIVQEGSTTTINNYDSSGNLTNSTTTSSGTGTGTGVDDEAIEGNCGAPNQPPCSVTLEDTSDKYAVEFQKIEDAKASLDTDMNNITDTFSDSIDTAFNSVDQLNPANFIGKYFGYGLPSSCSGIISTTIFTRPFVVDPCEKLTPLREILAWSFFVLTLFACSRILFSRSLL